MNETDRDDDHLDRMLAAARQQPPVPSPDLMVRVRDDAVRLQPGAGLAGPRPRDGVWVQMAQALGGWRGLGGLAAACAAGVWLGFSGVADLSEPIRTLAQMEDDLDVLGDGIWPAAELSEEG